MCCKGGEVHGGGLGTASYNGCPVRGLFYERLLLIEVGSGGMFLTTSTFMTQRSLLMSGRGTRDQRPRQSNSRCYFCQNVISVKLWNLSVAHARAGVILSTG